MIAGRFSFSLAPPAASRKRQDQQDSGTEVQLRTAVLLLSVSAYAALQYCQVAAPQKGVFITFMLIFWGSVQAEES